MKTKCLLAALATVSLASQSFAAGSVQNAKVISVRIDQDGRGLVLFDQAIGGTPPGCVLVDYANALAFDASTAGGKAILAAALAAKASDSTMAAYGTGTCSKYGNWIEDWSSGYVQ